MNKISASTRSRNYGMRTDMYVIELIPCEHNSEQSSFLCLVRDRKVASFAQPWSKIAVIPPDRRDAESVIELI